MAITHAAPPIPQTAATKPGLVVPPPELVARLRERVDASSVSRVALEIGASRSVIMTALAGMGLRAGSLLLLEHGLGLAGGR